MNDALNIDEILKVVSKRLEEMPAEEFQRLLEDVGFHPLTRVLLDEEQDEQ